MNTVKPESIAVFCLTPGGLRLAKRLKQHLPLTCYCSEKLQEDGFVAFSGSFAATAAQAFTTHTALVVIGATGLTVRVIAPLLKDKLSDPAVVVIDEHGQHVISLLSGHVGGANELTRYLAGVLGADPVITTATDVNQLSALDTLAVQLDADMYDFRQSVKIVNQMLVSDQKVGLFWDHDSLPDTEGRWQSERYDTRGFITVNSLTDLPPDLSALICVSLRETLPELAIPVFKLVPRRIVAGIGCRRATSFQLLLSLLQQQLAKYQLDPLALRAIGSVVIKEDEAALKHLSACCRVPFELYSVNELRQHEHLFPSSDFVRQTIGVGSVSQPVAWLMSDGHLVGDTLRQQGVTITLGVSH
ncbi:cobalamin (vitamin B12) biosynthesis CbiG protein [Tolumonas auensis DSM 9187]|uniref:Cobalamin (Vitamin B12) biosynthesis CbiG protein n=1 Tax=Tolumonas auensis (strain DSM 9187 / NBRC 110442 / TA 4) TaxID=595494 RepID=C4LFB7_TOLAT|nr:cobalt-precorrin 5A hydrolase [Tolumonas auensis]ACQ93284.1 cobalamin (vitamin B12) biosynthesis CbiG protein [Tolumonas auensis DSM 9187]